MLYILSSNITHLVYTV